MYLDLINTLLSSLTPSTAGLQLNVLLIKARWKLEEVNYLAVSAEFWCCFMCPTEHISEKKPVCAEAEPQRK